MRALSASFAGRRQGRSEMRSLWITRINAACRMNDISYSQFMHGLKLAKCKVNRKILADLAVNDAAGFSALVNTAKSKLA